jgi:hypothetical protein
MDVFERLYTFFSGDALHHHPISILSIQHPINQMVHSGFARDGWLSSDGGWLSRYALIRLIQSYAGCSADSSITISSGSALLIDSFSFTKGLDNLSTITSGGVGALEEAI